MRVYSTRWLVLRRRARFHSSGSPSNHIACTSRNSYFAPLQHTLGIPALVNVAVIQRIYQVYTRYIQGIYQRLGRGQAAGSRCNPGPGLFIDLPVSPQYFPGIYTL